MRGVPSRSWALRTYLCSRCKTHVPARPDGTANTIHGEKLRCTVCGTFVGWTGYIVKFTKKMEKIMENTLPTIPQALDPSHGNAPALYLQHDPDQTLIQGQKAAAALWRFATAGDAVVNLQGKKFLKCEGWIFLGRAFGLTARVVEIKEILEKPQTFQATAEIVNAHGEVVGSGIGICGRDEKAWASRPMYAVMSMCQTRAVSRAFRSVLSWVAVLAGCAPTPSEEVEDATFTPAPPAAQPRPQAQVDPALLREVAEIAKSQGQDPLPFCSQTLGRHVAASADLTTDDVNRIIGIYTGEPQAEASL